MSTTTSDPVLAAFDAFADAAETQITQLREEMRTLRSELGEMREMVAQTRAAQPMQGPPGPQGEPGAPGERGERGEQGPAGERGADGISSEEEITRIAAEQVRAALVTHMRSWYRGVFRSGEQYEPGQGATWDGCMWIATRSTATQPGTDDSWTLAIKRGRDGRDRVRA